MNIGIVTTWFECGAAYVSKQYMQLLQKTDNVFIYARGGHYEKGNPNWDLSNVWWGKKHSVKQVILDSTYIDLGDFAKWIKHNGIELVFFNEQRFFAPLIWCKQHNIKTVAYIDYYNERSLPLFTLYDCLICNTKKHLSAFKDFPNAVYLPWGTNTSLYKPSNDKHDKLTFFHSAGVGAYRKGTDILLKAFANLKNREGVKLIIHTQKSITKDFPHISSIIENLTEEGSLEIIEKTVTAPGLYHMGDVYVYPSRLDGIGLTLMEALSSGLACITIDNGPMNEFVAPEWGWLANIERSFCRYDAYYWPICVTHVESLTMKLQEAIDSKDHLNQMKINARQYALDYLDFEKNCSSLSSLLHNMRFNQMSDDMSDKVRKFDYQGLKVYYRILIPAYYFNHLLIKLHLAK